MVSLYFYDKKIKLPECTRLGNFNYKIFEAEKRRKKFLTNSFGFDILNKLLRKGRRPEKFGKEKERLENLKKRLKKVLDKANDFWYTE